MDERRFDGVTRALARTASRRAGLLAALAAGLGPLAAVAQNPGDCLPDGARCARRRKDRGKPCRTCCSGSSVRVGKRVRCAAAKVPVATGQPCAAAAGDVCADAAVGVTCQPYTDLAGQLFDRSGSYCLFSSPGACSAATANDPVCTGGFCSQGQCGDIEIVATCDADARSCTNGDLFFSPNPDPSTAGLCLCIVDVAGADVAVDIFDPPIAAACASNDQCSGGRVCWTPPEDAACDAFYPAASYCALPCLG